MLLSHATLYGLFHYDDYLQIDYIKKWLKLKPNSKHLFVPYVAIMLPFEVGGGQTSLTK